VYRFTPPASKFGLGNRTGNYAAFYVKEPFAEGNLGANAAKDFCYYNLLRAWKAGDSTFPFVDSHAKTYNVRDGSDWEGTLKPRLQERLGKSKNIVFFVKPYKNLDIVRQFIVNLSEAFPDKTIFMKVKGSFIERGQAHNLASDFSDRSNIIVSNEVNPYELMFKARYSISDPSTMAAEAIHFGLISFLLDIDDREALIFRDFPDLCIKTADEAIERIRSIEAGAWTYPRSKLKPLINYSRKALADYVEEDMSSL